MRIKALTAIALLGAGAALANLPVSDAEIIDRVVKEQGKHEKCVQIIKGNKRPDDETRLLKGVPDNVTVNTYENEHGKGCQIILELPDRTVSVGTGPSASDYTWTRHNTASST